MLETTKGTEIFRRVMEPERGTFSPEVARQLINLDFKGEDHERFEAHSAKAQDGTLTPDSFA